MRLTPAAYALAFTLAASACSDGTTGKRITLRTQVIPDPEAQAGFRTLSGWTVTLTEAALASGPLYFFDGTPAFVLRPAQGPWEWLHEFVVRAAYAHPGHYAEGVARGQMLVESSVNVLAGPALLPDGNGISGRFRSATFSFSPPIAGPALATLNGHTAVAKGVAVKDQRSVHFSLAVDFAELGARIRDGLVQGCVFDDAAVDGNGIVTLAIKPHVWFNLVDFSEVAPGTALIPTEIAQGTTAHIAFVLGLVQLSAYRFSFTPDVAKNAGAPLP
jgi:hypothetical protein